MTSENQEAVLEKIRAVFDTILEPRLNWNLNALNLLKSVEVGEDGGLDIRINVVETDPDKLTDFRLHVEERLLRFKFKPIRIVLRRMDVDIEGTSGVKRIILVGSGKGGVGKSTVAVGVADGLKHLGYSVGMMDADIYGPSLPMMLGVQERPEVLPDEYLMPIEAHGMKTMSIGYLMDKNKPIDWRGTLASGTLLQFIKRTFWGTLDYLVVDMPPGTGDVQLTLAQRLEADGVVVVSTPQEVVLGDVRRSVAMFEKHQIPVAGIVENMTMFACTKCGHLNEPFVRSTSSKDEDDPMSRYETLTSIPLDRRLSEASDQGVPVVTFDKECHASRVFLDLARDVVGHIDRCHTKREEWRAEREAELAETMKKLEAQGRRTRRF